MLKNIKYDIYQKMGNFFPTYFKNKTFSKVNQSLVRDSKISPPENELLILHLFLNQNSTILDVGANNGLYCFYFQEIIKSKKIVAFEPIPSLFKKLNIWFHGIDFYPFAISDKNSTTTLNIPYINSVKYETRAKLDSLKEKDENKVKKIMIETKTIDSLFINTTLKIDFIKIDIEGHELSVLKGLSLSLWRPLILIIEDSTDISLARSKSKIYRHMKLNNYLNFYRSGGNDWYIERKNFNFLFLIKLILHFDLKGLAIANLPFFIKNLIINTIRFMRYKCPRFF